MQSISTLLYSDVSDTLNSQNFGFLQISKESGLGNGSILQPESQNFDIIDEFLVQDSQLLVDTLKIDSLNPQSVTDPRVMVQETLNQQFRLSFSAANLEDFVLAGIDPATATSSYHKLWKTHGRTDYVSFIGGWLNAEESRAQLL